MRKGDLGNAPATVARPYPCGRLEDLIADRLKTHGAVQLTGPKAVGRTTTARLFAASEVRLDQDRAMLTAARTDPRLVLDGSSPRLIDEYQLADAVWEAVGPPTST